MFLKSKQDIEELISKSCPFQAETITGRSGLVISSGFIETSRLEKVVIFFFCFYKIFIIFLNILDMKT